jgi:hypothetical protein
MTTSSDRESAKIYQFPARGRFAASQPPASQPAASQREETNETLTLSSQQVVKVAVGSGWYHEAAIQEAERTHKN